MSVAKRSGIPIPSFDALDTADVSHAEKQMNFTPTNSTAALLQLDVSLQHWYRRRGPNNHAMSLDDFFAFVSKLDWSQTKQKVANDNAKKVSNADSGMTEEESLLYDLLGVAANPFMKDPLYRIDTDRGRIESLDHTGDKLRRALSAPCPLDKDWIEKVLGMIVAYRKSQKARDKEPKSTDATKIIAGDTTGITEGMTIDERVRAKAKARQQLEELIRKRQLEENPNGIIVSTDKTWTIQLADALCLYARSVLQRQNFNLPNKMASISLLMGKTVKRKCTEARRCVLSFRDLTQVISRSRLGEASAEQVAKALTDLEQFKPQWIQVMRKDSSSVTQPSSFKWCKRTTTVFVMPDNYAQVRSQLTGQPMPKARGQKIVLGVKNAETKATKGQNLVIAGSSLMNGETSAFRRQDAPPILSKNLLEAFDDTAGSRRSKTEVDKMVCTPSTTTGHSPVLQTPVTKKKRRRDGSRVIPLR